MSREWLQGCSQLEGRGKEEMRITLLGLLVLIGGGLLLVYGVYELQRILNQTKVEPNELSDIGAFSGHTGVL